MSGLGLLLALEAADTDLGATSQGAPLRRAALGRAAVWHTAAVWFGTKALLDECFAAGTSVDTFISRFIRRLCAELSLSFLRICRCLCFRSIRKKHITKYWGVLLGAVVFL